VGFPTDWQEIATAGNPHFKSAELWQISVPRTIAIAVAEDWQ